MESTPSIPSPNLFDLSGQNVLITGASRGQPHYFSFPSLFDLSIPVQFIANFHLNTNSGIGAACATALIQAGATLCLVLREPKDDAPPNLDTVNAIRNLNASAKFVYCDLNNLDAVKDVFQNALDAMGGRIDVLINCAGIQRRSPSLDFSETDWDDVRSHYAPHSSLIFLIWVQPRPFAFSFSVPLRPLLFRSLKCLLCSIGFRRQPQVRLAPFASRRPSHGSEAAREDNKLLLSPHFPRWYHRSRLRGCQGGPWSAHKSPKQ
jgi:short chain dehydrogenase